MVYHLMEEELKPEGIEVVSQSHFYALWNEHFRNTVIPKVTFTNTKLMTLPRLANDIRTTMQSPGNRTLV